MSRAELRELAPAALVLPDAVFDVVEDAYASPPRAYHSLVHVVEVAKEHARVARDVGWRDAAATYCAVLFHDAIYVAGAADNEAKSAALARATLADLPVDAGRASDLVMLTARHGSLRPSDVDADAALFLDCDMAILGSDPETFAAYDAAIRAEYAHVPEPLYRAGRSAFLQKLLDAPHIFMSPYFQERLDARARRNIAGALGRRAG